MIDEKMERLIRKIKQLRRVILAREYEFGLREAACGVVNAFNEMPEGQSDE